LERLETPLEEVTQGRDWRLCQALLTLHAIADEACAGLSVAFDYGGGAEGLYRAQSRELLARTGSLAPIAPCLPRLPPPAPAPRAGVGFFSGLGLRNPPQGADRLVQAAVPHLGGWCGDRARQRPVAAMAVAGERRRLPRDPGLGTAAREGALRLLRVCSPPTA